MRDRSVLKTKTQFIIRTDWRTGVSYAEKGIIPEVLLYYEPS